jgi:cholesterol transport system auxiliary component
VKRIAMLFCSAAVLLTACAGSLFKDKAPPPTMYVLAPAPKAQPPDAQKAATMTTNLAVLKPRVRPGLNTDRIAAIYPDRHMDYFADVRWSGPLDDVLQDLAVREFHINPGLRNVSADASVFASSYWLEIEVMDFQAEYPTSGSAPTVHVHLLARVGNSADRRVLARFEPDVRETATDNRMSAIIDAYNRAADEALAEIAANAAQTVSANP